jgi:hypothetical protein
MDSTEAKTLHIPASSNPNGFAIHVRKPGAGDTDNGPGRLFGTAGSPERNVREGAVGVVAAGGGDVLAAGDAQGDVGAVGGCDEGAFVPAGCETGGDVAEGNGVGAHAKGGPPFFGDGLGESDYAGFGDRVVDLSSVFVASIGDYQKK